MGREGGSGRGIGSDDVTLTYCSVSSVITVKQ